MKIQEIKKRVYTIPQFLDYRNNEYETDYRKDVLKIEKDTETTVGAIYISDVWYRKEGDKNAPWKYGYSYKRQSLQSKYPCIGGPLNGTKSVMSNPDYRAYNSRGSAPNLPSVVLIYKDLL